MNLMAENCLVPVIKQQELLTNGTQHALKFSYLRCTIMWTFSVSGNLVPRI